MNRVPRAIDWPAIDRSSARYEVQRSTAALRTPLRERKPMLPAVRQNPWAYAQGGGLSHSGFDPYRAATIDPFTYGRLLQTFPLLGTDPTRRIMPIY